MAAINDFVLTRGWNCIGTCGCAKNKYKYVSDKYKYYEIRIAVDNSQVFEIRHQDITRKSGTGIDQLQTWYNQMFND